MYHNNQIIHILVYCNSMGGNLLLECSTWLNIYTRRGSKQNVTVIAMQLDGEVDLYRKKGQVIENN